MARDGAGNYSRAAASPAAGQTISSTAYNTELNDVAAALTASIARDGQTTPTANMPMGGFRHTGVHASSGTARNEYPSTGVMQDGGPWWCATAGGAANALTLSPTPAIAAYTAGQRFQFIAAANNTSTVTVAVSGLATRAIQKGAAALASGDIDSGKTYEIIYDGAAFQLSEYSLGGSVTSITAGAGLSGGAITTAGTIALDVNSLTTKATPVVGTDFAAIYSDADAAPRKTAIEKLGRVVQRVYDEERAFSSNAGYTPYPNDDTRPEITEGVEIMSVSITPTSASNRIRCRAVVPVGPNAAAYFLANIHRGGQALATTYYYANGGSWMNTLVVEFEEASPGTSSVTYSVRVGASPSATAFEIGSIGGIGARRFGGAVACSLIVEEIAP